MGWLPLAQLVGWQGPSSGLTHRWPMDDLNVSGTTIIDVIAALNGTANGAGVSSTSGPSGGAGLARALDGASSINIGSTPIASFTSANSVFCWVKVTNVAADSGVQSQRAFNYYVNATNFVTMSVGGSGADTGQLSVEYQGGGSNFGRISTTTPMVNGTWTHVGYTTDGASNVVLYVNGASVASGAPPGDGPAAFNYIGSRSAIQAFLTGSIAQTVVYNRILSGAEITQLYNAF